MPSASSPGREVLKFMDHGMVVREFDFQWRSNIHFRTKSLEKVWNALPPPPPTSYEYNVNIGLVLR